MISVPCLWIVGDWRHANFSDAVKWIVDRTSCALFDDPSTALNGQQAAPHAILLVQSRPGQFSNQQVERLHAAAPLARLVALTGPWCEGEMRSGQPWPGVARVPWRAWRARLPEELGLGARNGSVPAPPPRTATEAEQIDRATRLLKPHSAHDARAIVCTARKDSLESVADALKHFGWQSTWHVCCPTSLPSPCDLVIFDGWERIADVPQRDGERRLLLLDFPRPEDFVRALTLGIDIVVGLPLLLTDLATALTRPQNEPS